MPAARRYALFFFARTRVHVFLDVDARRRKSAASSAMINPLPSAVPRCVSSRSIAATRSSRLLVGDCTTAADAATATTPMRTLRGCASISGCALERQRMWRVEADNRGSLLFVVCAPLSSGSRQKAGFQSIRPSSCATLHHLTEFRVLHLNSSRRRSVYAPDLNSSWLMSIETTSGLGTELPSG